MRTLHEGARGCGFRKPGGLYMVTDREGEPCPALPVEMVVCPHCGAGIRPSRAWTWITPDVILNPHDHGHPGCPLNAPGLMGDRAGLLWIGGSFYPTPDDWMREAQTMGVSRRIATVPRGFVIGETWVAVAHRKVIRDGWVNTDTDVTYRDMAAIVEAGVDFDLLEEVWRPAVFHVFKPQRIEYVVRGDESDEELAGYERRGIEPVRVIPLEQQILDAAEGEAA